MEQLIENIIMDHLTEQNTSLSESIPTDFEVDSSLGPLPADVPDYSVVDETIGDPYCFESDHVALKGNADYHRLIQTMVMLEAQRTKGLEDLETLFEAKDKALKDPLGFLTKLKTGVDVGVKLPAQQTIAEIPDVNWERYTSSVDFSSFGLHRQSARLKRHGSDVGEDENLQRLKANLVGGIDGAEGTEGFVRGRYRDDSKSVTFNKLWTCEEQKRLEELLHKFPPEEVEARRWRKIADALGNRTPQQVASRVQKFFEKLERARLPIPGRAPNKMSKFRFPKVKKGHRQPRWSIFRESTFLHSYKPPVTINDDDIIEEGSCMTEDMEMDDDTNSSVNCVPQKHQEEDIFSEKQKNSTEYKELLRLKSLRQAKIKHLESSVMIHHEFRCDRCGCDPIVGLRWHCVDCPSSTTVDFCETCADSHSSFETATHNSSHRIRPVKRMWSKRTQDQDYMMFENEVPGQYNYLDPNYMPAV